MPEILDTCIHADGCDAVVEDWDSEYCAYHADVSACAFRVHEMQGARSAKELWRGHHIDQTEQQREYRKLWRTTVSPEKARLSVRRYQKRHPDQQKRWAHEWRQRNREHRAEYQRNRRAALRRATAP